MRLALEASGVAAKGRPSAVLFHLWGHDPGVDIELHQNASIASHLVKIMKTRHHTFLLAVSLAAIAAPSYAQTGKVWRCGNEYTNNATVAQQRGCKVMEGGNVTVVQTSRPNVAAAGGSSSGARSPAGSPRVESADQRARDNDARTVLESELRKAESKQAELLKEYNNGQPEKQGSEAKNYQKYLDRTAEMKAQIDRNESDIAGIRRELGRLAPPAAAAPGPTTN